MARAGDIIDEARDYHPGFTEERFPNRMLLRRLGRAQHKVYEAVADRDPDFLAQEVVFGPEEVQAALAARAPLSLPEYLAVSSARVYYNPVADYVESLPVRLLATRQRLSHVAPFPSATPVAGGILLTDLRDTGDRTHGWENLARLEIRYVPRPAPPTSVNAELSAPDDLTDALVGDLVSFMALRSGVEDADLRQMGAREFESLLAELSIRGQGRTWHVEPAWP